MRSGRERDQPGSPVPSNSVAHTEPAEVRAEELAMIASRRTSEAPWPTEAYVKKMQTKRGRFLARMRQLNPSSTA